MRLLAPVPLRLTAYAAAALAANLALVALLSRAGVGRTVIVGAIPAALVVAAALVSSNRSVLVFGALALEMTAKPITHLVLNAPGGLSLYPSDILVLLAIASWAAARLVAAPHERPRAPSTLVLGWPFALFACAVLSAVVRGHAVYGTSYFGLPTKLVLYAGIGFALVDLEPAKVYRGLVVVFYAGTVWMDLNAVYYLATGTSQVGGGGDDILSTGGVRVVSLTVAMYLAAALFLALLNLGIATTARGRGLHTAIAALALFGIVNAFGRSTFSAVALALPFVFVFGRRIRSSLLGLVPLLLPFVALVAVLVPLVVPKMIPTLIERVSKPASHDASYLARVAGRNAVLAQYHESPLFGVGFGRQTSFSLNGIHYDVGGQDPHNGYVYLLAAGGLFALGSFVLVSLAFVRDAARRYRAAVDPRERIIVLWAGLGLLVLLVNTFSGQQLTTPSAILTIWTLLLLPSVVPLRRDAAGGSAAAA